MREIKFRVWDRCNGRMVDPRNILKICMSRLNQEPYLIVYLRKWMNENREIKESDKCYTNEFELMQYTGLKDKNGVEIYEGDILKYTGAGEEKVDHIMYDAPISTYSKMTRWSLHEDEIIGNIYENPELLEKENDNE